MAKEKNCWPRAPYPAKPLSRRQIKHIVKWRKIALAAELERFPQVSVGLGPSWRCCRVEGQPQQEVHESRAALAAALGGSWQQRLRHAGYSRLRGCAEDGESERSRAHSTPTLEAGRLLSVQAYLATERQKCGVRNPRDKFKNKTKHIVKQYSYNWKVFIKNIQKQQKGKTWSLSKK